MMIKKIMGSIAVVITGCAFLSCGCGLMQRQLELPEEGFYMESQSPSPNPVEDDNSQSNSYFLFLESQVLKNQGRLDESIDLMKMAIDREPDSLYLKTELAVLYLYKKDNEKALKVVEEILARNPDSVDALIMAATIKKTQNKDADVKALYERVLVNDPNRKSAYQILGKMYFSEGNMDKAFQIYTKMIERFPDDYVGYYYIGEIYAAQAKYDKAEASFLKTLELAPSLVEGRLELVKIYRLTRQKDKEIAMYEEIFKQYPENITVAIELGLLYGPTNPAASDEIFTSLGEKSIDDPNVIGTVIQYLVLQKRIDHAITVLEGMSRGAPESSEIAYAAGIVYHEKGDTEQALQNFGAVSPSSRFYQNAVVHIAVILYNNKEFDQGIEVLEAAMLDLVDTDKVAVIPYLTSFYKERGRLDDAATLIREGLEIAPGNTDLLLELGIIYDKQGKTDAAIEQMKAVIAIDAEQPDALNYLGYTYADKGIFLDEAEAMVRKALLKKPDNGYILDSLGWVYYKKGLLDQALAELLKAVKLIPDDPVILEHLGDVYKNMNKSKEALEYYQKALSVKGDNRDGLEKKMQSLKQRK